MFNKHAGTLDMPPVAARSHCAIEVARVWIADGAQHVTLRPEAWEDPAAWGLLLVDLARHVAHGFAQVRGADVADTLARIREGFDTEWDSPTDTLQGQISE